MNSRKLLLHSLELALLLLVVLGLIGETSAQPPMRQFGEKLLSEVREIRARCPTQMKDCFINPACEKTFRICHIRPDQETVIDCLASSNSLPAAKIVECYNL